MRLILRNIFLTAALLFGLIIFGNAYAEDILYVTDKIDRIYVIDPLNLVVTDTIHVGKEPYDIAIDSIGFLLYVSNQSDGTVQVIDTSDNTLKDTTFKVGKGPNGILLHPDGRRLYVANSYDDTVSVIDTVTEQVTTVQGITGDRPHDLAVRPDGRYVYVGCKSSQSIAIIDTESNSVSNYIDLEADTFALAMGPEKWLYATNYNANRISVIDTDDNSYDRYIETPLFMVPWGIAAGKNGKRLYVLGEHNRKMAIYNVETDDILLKEIDVAGLYGIAVSTDNSNVYVTGRNTNRLPIVDTKTYDVHTVTDITMPWGIAVLNRGNTGLITGRVTTPIPGQTVGVLGATVTITETGHSTTTNNEGEYQLSNVEEGTYTLTIEANPDYFEPFLIQDVTVTRMEPTLVETVELAEPKGTQCVIWDIDGNEVFTLKEIIYGLQMLSGIRP